MILSTADEIMGALERGDLAKDFARACREVLTALVEQDGGKGSVSLKLKFAAKGNMVTIVSALDQTIPKPDRRTSNFFITSEGQLSLQHPDQIDMAFVRARREAVDAD